VAFTPGAVRYKTIGDEVMLVSFESAR